MGIDRALLRNDHFEHFKNAYFKEAKANVEIPVNVFDTYGEFNNVDPLADGMRIIEEIQATLNKFRRHPLQVKMHQGMIKCCAKIIFGCETVLKYDGLLRKRFGWPNLKQEQIITAPRRFGKTKAVAMFICAFLLAKPKGEAAVFSTGARASGIDTGMLKAVMEMLVDDLKVPAEFIELRKGEHLTIDMGNGDIRRLHAYPASQDAYVFFSPLEREKNWYVCFDYLGVCLSVPFSKGFFSLFPCTPLLTVTQTCT